MSDLDLMRRALELIEQAIDACDGVSEWPDDVPLHALGAAAEVVEDALALRESSLLGEGALDSV